MGLLSGNITDANAIFTEVDNSQVLPTDFRFGQVYGFAE